MLPIITKVLLLLGLLILMIANISTDWVNMGVSRKYKDSTKTYLSNEELIEVNAGLWSQCSSISGDLTPIDTKKDRLAIGGIGGCRSINKNSKLKDTIIACQTLSIICIGSVLLALICSLINRKLHLLVSVLCLVALACGIAVLVLYATKIEQQEIGSESDFDTIKTWVDNNSKILHKDANMKAFRGFGSGYYLQIVGVSLASIAGILSFHQQKM